jgi:hypothetical protein
MSIATQLPEQHTPPTPQAFRLLGVWPVHGALSEHKAHHDASLELAKMCADHRVLPNGPQVTIILRSLADCIGAGRKLGVRTSRLMFMVEELATDTPVAVAASVPVYAIDLVAA